MTDEVIYSRFISQTIETWQANSSKGNAPTTTKILFPWQLTLFQCPPTLFQPVGDFQHKSINWCYKLEVTYSYACWIIHRRHHWQISKWNAKGGPERPLIQERSGTQYVAMVTKLSSSYCGADLVECYCKESNIFDTNWLRYLSLSHLLKIWLSV